jgi:hypothetical protein
MVKPPREGRVHDHALGHAGGVVAAVEGEVLLPVSHAIAEVGVAPAQRAGQLLGVGVEQQLVGIEAVPAFGRIGAVDAVTVELAGPDVGEVDVPDLVGVLGQRDALDLAPASRVEQAQVHALRILREQGEVDAASVPGGAARMREPRPDAQAPPGHRARPAARVELQAAPLKRRPP